MNGYGRAGNSALSPPLIQLTTQAAHTWAEIFAALASTFAVCLLVWDRMTPKPLQISGYVTLGTWEDQTEATVYLFSEAGERLIMTSIRPSIHFEMALLPEQTVAARKREPAPLRWSHAPMKVRAIAERGHSGDTPMFKVLLRVRGAGTPWNRLMRWAMPPAIITTGVLPYRQKGQFRQPIALPEGDLLNAIR